MMSISRPNKLIFSTPNGIDKGTMDKVTNQLTKEFDWLHPDHFMVYYLHLGEDDGTISFTFQTDPFIQHVKIIFSKFGTDIAVTADDPGVCIDVCQALCRLDWGWKEWEMI